MSFVLNNANSPERMNQILKILHRIDTQVDSLLFFAHTAHSFFLFAVVHRTFLADIEFAGHALNFRIEEHVELSKTSNTTVLVKCTSFGQDL